MFIMGSQRREFTPEYKDEAVKLVINTGRPVATVARELGITEQSLGWWVNAFKARGEAGGGALSETERAELGRLRKLLARSGHDMTSLHPPLRGRARMDGRAGASSPRAGVRRLTEPSRQAGELERISERFEVEGRAFHR